MRCCITLSASWPEGGGCLFCHSSNDCFYIFAKAIAASDLWKGNVTWQVLLTSQKHLRASSCSLSICHLTNRHFFGGLILAACDLLFMLSGVPPPPHTHTLDDSVAQCHFHRREQKVQLLIKDDVFKSINWGDSLRGLTILRICNKKVLLLPEGADMWDQHNYLPNKLRDFIHLNKGELWKGFWRGLMPFTYTANWPNTKSGRQI